MGQTSSSISEQATSAPFDVEQIRAQIPQLSRTIRGRALVYLDNAATALRPQSVIDAEVGYYTTCNANVHRGVHTLSQEATVLFERARDSVRRGLNAERREEVVFTSGTTGSVNLVAQSWGRAHLGAGDEILITGMEHHSNIVPWYLLAGQTGAVVRVVPILDDGAEPVGMKAVPLNTSPMNDRFDLVEDPGGAVHYQARDSRAFSDRGEGTDVDTLYAKYITLTPLHYEQTDNAALKRMQGD